MEFILVVDDDEQLCKVLSEELKEVGYDSDYVTRAEHAVEYLHSGKSVDLVLLDLKMPVKDGFYVLENITNNNISVKVIVLTAYADVTSAIASTKLGANDFIGKPYDLDELLISIRKVLQM
jgi:two-component system response regulator HydG